MQEYPVKMEATDFVLTLVVVTIITFLVSIRPALQAAKLSSVQHL